MDGQQELETLMDELVSCGFVRCDSSTARKDMRDFMARVRAEAKREGISAYAWWKDGEQYVGTCGTRLRDALAAVQEQSEPAGASR